MAWLIVVTVEITAVQVVVVVSISTGSRRPDVVRIARTRCTTTSTAAVASGRTPATVVVTKSKTVIAFVCVYGRYVVTPFIKFISSR